MSPTEARQAHGEPVLRRTGSVRPPERPPADPAVLARLPTGWTRSRSLPGRSGYAAWISRTEMGSPPPSQAGSLATVPMISTRVPGAQPRIGPWSK